MLALIDQVKEPLVATDEEAIIAKEAADRLKALSLAGVDLKLRAAENPSVVVPLPARAMEMIVSVLRAMAERKPVSVIPHTAELTTQQAADCLNVSRPFLVGLIDKNEIPHRMVGTHRRVRVSDLVAFKERSDKKRRAAIHKMVAEGQKHGLP
jgi:excisionase family DNA binding protein